MTLKALLEAWRRFFFEPQLVLPLALYRIVFGLLVLQSLLIHVGVEFLTWYGPNAIIPLEAVKEHFWHNSPRFDVMLLLPREDGWFIAYFASLVIAAVLLVLGLCTRYSAAYVCLGLISLHHHDPFNINGGDTFLRLTSMFLAVSPCGEAWSVDNWIKRKRGIEIEREHSPWALRMIQIQLCIAYCDTFFCKIVGTQWLEGIAVYYAVRLDDMQKFNLPFGLYDQLWFCKFLTWYTLVIEFAMWTFVWFREARYYCLAGALLLHLGIDMTINLPVFEWAFIACLATFIYPGDLLKLEKRAKAELARRKASAVSPAVVTADTAVEATPAVPAPASSSDTDTTADASARSKVEE